MLPVPRLPGMRLLRPEDDAGDEFAPTRYDALHGRAQHGSRTMRLV
jgi:hypothetical protein